MRYISYFLTLLIVINCKKDYTLLTEYTHTYMSRYVIESILISQNRVDKPVLFPKIIHRRVAYCFFFCIVLSKKAKKNMSTVKKRRKYGEGNKMVSLVMKNI